MRLKSGVFAASCVAVEVLGVAIFLRGFFPASVRSSSRTEHLAESPAPEPLAGSSSNWTKLPPPLFSKAVVMLIDALRDDFVFGSKGARYMPFTTYLMEKGPTHSFVSEAKPPTVTMPRIKALMTGSLPGFVDVIRNLNSPALLEDNLISQAKAAGKRMIFYGDETWVKLFPKHFVEYDGTTSFFVSDYTEVDNNVTRHLDKVLKRGDWDMLILHYLGLDHIGHVSGPDSPLIGHKLREMDGILMKIHTALLTKERETPTPSLLVVCGDHGMSETGSHGAASTEEVRTPLILVSSAFERKPGDVRHPTHIQQTDLAATLSVGLGLPIPKDSLGNLLFPVIERRPMRERLRFLHLNAVQLSRLLQEAVPSYEKDPGFEQFMMAERLHGSWVKLHLEEGHSDALLSLGTKVARQYLGALRTLSLALSTHVAQYDVYSMVALTLLLLSTPQVLCRRAEPEVPLSFPVFSLLFYLMFLLLSAIHVVVCTSAESSCYLCGLPWLAAGGVMMLVSAMFCVILSAVARMFSSSTALRKSVAHPYTGWSEMDFLLLLGTVGHVLTLGASSFVEEEHQTWYFLVNTLCLALCRETCRSYFLRDDCEPQHCSRVQLGSQGAAHLQQNCTAYKASTPGQLREGPSTSGAPKGHEHWTVLVVPWLVLACCRLLRSLNHTGVQGAHQSDLGHWLTSANHRVELSCLAALSLLAIFMLAQRGCSPVSKVALALGLLGVFCYRAAIGNVLFPWQLATRGISKGIIEARFVYVFVLGILFTGTKDLLKSEVIAANFKTVGLWEIYSGLVLLAALLLRPHNLPVLAFSLLIQTVMTKFIWKPLKHDAAEITIMHYWFGQAFFYFQGNSNNIATVDISAGFVGLDTYMEIPATFLTVFGTYVGPVLWAGHLAHFLSTEADRGSAAGRACFCYALICSVPVAAYVIFVTSLRYHLFIWSVFSPKLLYEGMHLLVTAALCVLLTATEQTSHARA
ncbi:GPI ethanolamine phosphate transferase 2 isoform 2-T2 [Ctenodactylus gundi]